MSQGKVRKSWKITRGHLDRARALLPEDARSGAEGGTLSNLEDWLEHNELELALDELEMLGDANEVAEDYWAALLSAAREMRLQGHVDRYLARLER